MILDKHPVKSITVVYFLLSIIRFCCSGAPTPVRNLISVQEGLPAALECEATQFRLIQTAITFEWFKNGVQIVNSSNSLTLSVGNGKYKGTLTLASVRKADANSYTCRANGHSGLSAASVAITLDVTCKLLIRYSRAVKTALFFRCSL